MAELMNVKVGDSGYDRYSLSEEYNVFLTRVATRVTLVPFGDGSFFVALILHVTNILCKEGEQTLC